MKRIIFTVVNDLTYDQRMHRICNTLSVAGYNVLLVGRKLKTSIPLTNEKFAQRRLHVFFRKGKLFYIEYNLRLLFFLLFQKPDIICGIDLDTILPCYFISRIRKKKCVYDAHEIFPEVPEVIHRPFTKGVWLSVEKFCVGKIKNCYTVSQGLAAYFETKYSRKFEVIRNVPLLDELHITSPAETYNQPDRFVIYQGALNAGRGLEHLIEAMEHVPVKLKLAGEGDLADILRAIVHEKQLEGKIEFCGIKKPGELKELTKQSFLGVNLLENQGLSYYYSLANKFFDYVHSGVPVITMNFPEYISLNAEYQVALLVNDLKAETLTSALVKLMDDKDYYFSLRENCLFARREWNWQREEQKLLAFYRLL